MNVTPHRVAAPSPLALAVLLAALAMVSPFSIDTFFPSFPAIAHQFHLDAFQIQQSITVYLLPYACMSLVHGPLSDALGRRPIVLWGLALYVLASLGCTLAPNFGTLLAFRALQGMTGGTGMTVSRAVVRDLYEGVAAQKLLSVITTIFGFAPAIAPVIGGWIQVGVGWRGVFAFLTVVGLVLLAVAALRLPETHPPASRRPFELRGLANSTWSVGKHPECLLLSMASGFNFAAVVIFVGAAPQLVLVHWKLAETQFAWLFLPVIAGFVLGAFVSGRLAGRMPPAFQIRIGFAVTFAAVAVRFALHASVTQVPIPVQQLLLFGSAIGVQINTPVLSLRLLDLFPSTRGAAASVQSFMSVALTALTLGLAVPLLQGSLVWLAAGSLVAAVLAVGCAWGAESAAAAAAERLRRLPAT
jgi:DHA1 family bicyclomycin/chloramphenicol resistance-like MFS transporter